MTSDEVNSLTKAHRNARIISWVTKLSVGEQDDLRALYAGFIGCPICEVPPWDGALMDDDELDWMYATCGNQINRP